MISPVANADKIQSVLTDNLLATPEHIADIKQVLEFMVNVAQSISEPQIRALILLKQMGDNDRLHEKNPYADIIKKIEGDYKKMVADTAVYLDTMQEIVPKPPRPIVLAPGAETGKKGR